MTDCVGCNLHAFSAVKIFIHHKMVETKNKK